MKTCLQDLRQSYRIAAEQTKKNDSRYLVIRYEELCEVPQTVITRITEFLDIEPDPCLFKATVAGEAAHVNSSFSADMPAGIILKTPKQPDLSAQDSKLLGAFISRAASQVGYPLKSLGKIQSLLIKLKFGLINRVMTKI